MSEEETAMDLRIRLVREVAALEHEAKLLRQQIEIFNEGSRNAENNRKKFLENLGKEVASFIEADTLEISVMEIMDKYRQYREDAVTKQEEAKREIAEAKRALDRLEETSINNLRIIVNEIQAGKYGSGEIEISEQSLVRVFGFIEEFDVKGVCFALHLTKGRTEIFHIDVQKVAGMCEDQKNQPPLIWIDVQFMPLSKEEKASLCRNVDDLSLLRKHISTYDIFTEWSITRIHLVANFGGLFDVYLVSLGNPMNGVLVRADMEIYPVRSLVVLGEIPLFDNEDFSRLYLDQLEYKDYKENKSDKILAISSDKISLPLSMVASHICSRHPGLAVYMPQLEAQQ